MAFGTAGTDTESYLEAVLAREPKLQEAFNRVQNRTDWKAPIDWTGCLDNKQATLTIEAVSHYTATPARIRYLTEPGKSGLALVRITAAGYRAGPAGDH